MRMLLTGAVDTYGHSLIYLFLGNGSLPDNALNDRSFFHNQLRPCLNILTAKAQHGIAIVVDLRDLNSVDSLHGVLSSLNEVCSNISLCYFLEPTSRQLRRALCRFVKCGNDDSGKKSSALKIPFQSLLFSNTKGLKEHIKSDMLLEELGGTLAFDEVSYLLQIAVIDTFGKLKSSLSSMHSFIESASSGELLDGDISTCLEQFSKLREQAISLYSHLKNVCFDRFDPFPLFRKLLAEGDALHSLATQIRGMLMERQDRLNAFSTLCTKLGEGEKALETLERLMATTAVSFSSRLQLLKEDSPVNLEQFFVEFSGPSAMADFLRDVRYLVDMADKLNDELLEKQVKAAFNLEALRLQTDRVESQFAITTELLFKAKAIEEQTKAESKIIEEQKPAPENFDVTCASSNSPCPMTSSSLSDDVSRYSFGNKTIATTPTFSEVSPVTDARCESIGLVQKDVKKSPKFQYPVITPKELPKPSGSLAPAISTLSQLVSRFENRAQEIRRPQGGIRSVNRQVISDLRQVAEKLEDKVEQMKDRENRFPQAVRFGH